ncbi:MAG: hypothetical protein R2704_08270 [Microthrixaceae bacterium]|nr:hypothetical protein [Microthrixaceae bacterium]
MSRRWYAAAVAVAVLATIGAVLGLLRSPEDRRADAGRWGTGELIETDDVPVERDASLEASTDTDEVMRRRLTTVPTVAVEPTDDGFRLGWEEPAACRGTRIVINETETQVLVEVTSAEPFATPERTGCAQRGPRGDDVEGVLPVHVTPVELDEPLGDRSVLDAARARELQVVID